ncbi:DNA primase small subunit [Chelonia mydas]|uniref:DNA primase n=1 Tax=Chelonia mydas TaxID=8469 RepID=M7AX93_CHEMY|nr:DNA primase small subunit [Chelonia mydas]
MQRMNPYKIDVGAVYSHRPSQCNAVHRGAFQAQEKELVFDIDMTDYDDVRSCCSSAEICSKCWTLMPIAIRVIDRALVGKYPPRPLGPIAAPVAEDFGVKHRLWVYSGRRGVHCWVCDDSVRKWSSAMRSATVEYLTLVKGGSETVKKVNLTDPIHPFISNSLSLVEPYFEEYALVGQDILGSKESWEKVVALVPEHILRLFAPSHAESEIMLQFCFPRLDINVSKGVSHLLKSPFSVHPKTGHARTPVWVRRGGRVIPVPRVGNLASVRNSASRLPPCRQPPKPLLVSDQGGEQVPCQTLPWLMHLETMSFLSGRELTVSSCLRTQVSVQSRNPHHLYLTFLISHLGQCNLQGLMSPVALGAVQTQPKDSPIPCLGSWKHAAGKVMLVLPLLGRVSVPIDLQKLDQFDPFAVPTISRLCSELDTAHEEEEDGEKENEAEPVPKRRTRDYKKTSLAPYVRVFERFVEEMDKSRKGELLRRGLGGAFPLPGCSKPFRALPSLQKCGPDF